MTDLPLMLNSGLVSRGGETMTVWLGLFSTTNSSKVILMLLLSNIVEWLAGLSLTILGGVVSLGPPTGATILAQLANKNVKNKKMPTRFFIKKDLKCKDTENFN